MDTNNTFTISINKYSFNIMAPINYIINMDKQINKTNIIGPFYNLTKYAIKTKILIGLLQKYYNPAKSDPILNVNVFLLLSTNSIYSLFNMRDDVYELINYYENNKKSFLKETTCYLNIVSSLLNSTFSIILFKIFDRD